MSHIATIIAPSKHVQQPHMQFVADGVPLDEMLSDWYENDQFVGLVPTTLNWMQSEAEQAVVWERFLDRTAQRQVVPILCCPDDLDFSCGLVVVDTRITGRSVEWRAFGFDHTPFDQLPQGVGSSVNWLPPERPLIFDRQEFDVVADQFVDWAEGQIE